MLQSNRSCWDPLPPGGGAMVSALAVCDLISPVRHALLHEGILLLQVELERLLFAIFGPARGRLALARVRLVPNGIVVGIDIDVRRLGIGSAGRCIPAAAAPDDVI